MHQNANSFINNIIINTDIVIVISSFLPLKKSGSGFFAKCPFHKENTASFYVNSKTQKYYCFGCHKCGNVLNFLMAYKKCSFNTAVKLVSCENKIYPRANNYLDADNIFSTCNKILKNSFFKKDKIFEFLIKRHLDLNTVSAFNIGFMPGNINFFFDKKNLDCTQLQLKRFGILAENNNRFYNRFNNRIIFPIRNLKGQVVGLGGRSLFDDIKPKYINSPESKIFSKKKELYGLYEAINLKKKSDIIIIVEGYFDVITLYKYGIYDVVAILGTALSKEHILILKSFYKKIIFCLDGDNAGKIAALRSAYLCLSSILDFDFIKFAIIPNKLDPDSFVKKYGKEKFLDILNKAIFILDFILINLNIVLKTKKNDFYFFIKLNKLLLKIDNILVKNFIIDYVTSFFYLKRFKIFYRKKFIIPLGIKACFYLLKDKSLFFKINILEIISNKKIFFNSDLHIFFDLIFLLKHNFNLTFIELNKRLIKKIYINDSDFLCLLNRMPKNILESEFFSIIGKIMSD